MSEGLYDNIVMIVENYLGPAAPRFVDRQIQFHLSKAPAEISPEDVPRLVEWIKISLALLTDNQATIEECAQRLISLT